MLSHARLGFPGSFADVGLSRVIVAVAIQFVNYLPRREFFFIPTAEDVLEALSWREDGRASSFVENTP